MDFDWTHYLSLARFLPTQSIVGVSQEAFYRCAVSRAYYAAFCHARNYARDRHGLQLRYNGDDHALVRRHFQARRAQGVAAKLRDLSEWRNLCDYEDAISNLPALLAQALTEAQMVIAILK